MVAKKKPGEELTEAWSMIAPLLLSRRDSFFAMIGSLGLTPPHGHALMSLVHGPVRMRDLADSMGCDASYVTALVDRLAELGLAARRETTTDRRVREVVLTAKGRGVARQISAHFAEPPAALEVLSSADRAALVRILRKLPPADLVLWPAMRRLP